MKTTFRTGALGLLTGTLALLAQAQPLGGVSLGGNVQSDKGEALTGASVTAIHLPTGVRRVVATDGLGTFSMADLVAGGPYTVQVTQPGFRPQLLTNVFLVADKPVKLDLTLDTATGETRRAARNAPK